MKRIKRRKNRLPVNQGKRKDKKTVTKPSDESKGDEDEEVDELGDDEEVDELDEDEEIKDKSVDELGDDEDLDIFQFAKRMPSEVVAHRLKTSTFYMNNRKKVFIAINAPIFKI